MEPLADYSCKLSDADAARLLRVSHALPITADVSRADFLLYAPHNARHTRVLCHAMPRSISSYYNEEAAGRVQGAAEQPLVLHALHHGRGGRRRMEVVASGAPVIQDVYPIFGQQGQPIAALVVETNMIAHERQLRRDAAFRQAVLWLLEMCLAGELTGADRLSRFGIYDGVYLVDRSRTIAYMSGIAANLFRSAGLAVDTGGQLVTELEHQDDVLVEAVFLGGECLERRDETEDGRVWVRKALPLRRPPVWYLGRRRLSRPRWPGRREWGDLDAVLVLLHNATDAVQRQRELNVKSAIIQEIHHRVKNNLQTVAAILRIQARRVETDEARQQLSDAVNRILSVAVIHEFLSEDEHRPINIRDLCLRIADQVRRVAGNPDQEIEIEVRGPNIRLPAGQATPTAMVINELVLNAMEHGLADYTRGRIRIDLRDLGDRVEIAIRNSGADLPADFDARQHTSLGLQIVHTLVHDDLKGELHFSSIADALAAAGGSAPDDAEEETILQGTQALVTFPKRPLKVD
jgi:two-component sensor histidine kinase